MISSCTNEVDILKVDEVNLTKEETFTRDTDPTSCFDQLVIPTQYVCDTDTWSGNITLADYPGCTFQVSSGFNKCTDPFTGVNFLYIEEINLVGHDCQAYNDAVALAELAGTLDAFSAEFDGELIQATTYMIGSQNLGPFGSVIVNYQTASCNNYCYVPVDKNGNFSPLIYTRTNCGTACCLIISDVYYSYSCECVMILTSNETAIGITCENFTPDCGPRSLYSTDCVFVCDYLVN